VTLARIKKGDDVIVLTGRERGKRGVVREVMPKRGKALVQDINISKRHFKPGRARQAGIVDVEQPIHLSNLALVDPKSNKATRVRSRELRERNYMKIISLAPEVL